MGLKIIQKIKNLLKKPSPEPVLNSTFITLREELSKEELKKQKIKKLKEEFERQKQRDAFYFAIDAAAKLVELGVNSYINELQSLGERALEEGYINFALKAYAASNFQKISDEKIKEGIENALDIGATLISLDALLDVQDSNSGKYRNFAAQETYRNFTDKITREIWQESNLHEKKRIRKIREVYSLNPLSETKA